MMVFTNHDPSSYTATVRWGGWLSAQHTGTAATEDMFGCLTFTLQQNADRAVVLDVAKGRLEAVIAALS